SSSVSSTWRRFMTSFDAGGIVSSRHSRWRGYPYSPRTSRRAARSRRRLSSGEFVECRDRAPRRKADTLRQLRQLQHVVRQKNEHGPVVWIGLPPAAVSARPSDRAYPTAAANDICVVGLHHHS